MDATDLVRRFAAELGWNGLERTDIRLTRDICGSLPVGTIVTWGIDLKLRRGAAALSTPSRMLSPWMPTYHA